MRRPFGSFVPRADLSLLEPRLRVVRYWWAGRNLREQVLIGVLAAVAIFAALLVGVIVPLRAMREQALADLHYAALIDARLRAGGETQGATTMIHGTASAVLTDSAAAAHLAIARIEPEAGQTRVVLGDAPFDQVLQWAAKVEQTSRLRIRQAQIDHKPAPGIVGATFLFGG
jgi:type II secretory pathway component PulM